MTALVFRHNLAREAVSAIGGRVDQRAFVSRFAPGARLLALTGQEVVDWSPSSGLYLWVLEQNSDARAFYAARGGACVERGEVPPPGGDAARLNGKPMGLRYAWRDSSKLLSSRL